jgi:steroid delta-isomerase-like uncharacterized protein
VQGEHRLPVAPLPLAAADAAPATIASAAAVQLFTARARAVRPTFQIAPTNAAAVARLCRHLDGLPLAIELAAAHSAVLSPAALLERMPDRLRLLAGGARDLPARQQTMRAAIAWSYDRLADADQRVFRRLAVFAGGWTLPAAAAVLERDDEATLVLLERLVSQSLVQTADSARFTMLETIRAFALDALQAAAEEDAIRARHAWYFLLRAEQLTHSFQLFQSQAALAPLAGDRNNLVVALTWCDAHGDAETLLRLNVALYGLSFASGLYHERLTSLERALLRTRDLVAPARAQALAAGVMLAIFQGAYARAADYSAEALVLARTLGDPFLVGQALTISGLVAYRQGNYDQSEALLTEAHRRLIEQIEDGPHVAVVAGIAHMLLGDTALAQEQFARASAPYAQASELFRAIGDEWRLSDAQGGQGGLRFCQGDVAGAATIGLDNVARAQRVGYAMTVASTLFVLAGVAATFGDPDTGARLLGAAEGIATALGSPLYPRDRPVLDRVHALLTAALGPAALATTRAAGRQLSREQAVAMALARVPPAAAHTPDRAAPETATPGNCKQPGERSPPKVQPLASVSRRVIVRRQGSAGAIAVTAAFTSALARAQAPTAAASIAQAWTDAWNSHDSAQVASLFTPDGMYEDLAFGLTAHGADGITKFADGFFKAAPDLHIKLVAGFGTETWAAAEWVFSGTDTGGVAGAPTGKRFEVRGATIFALKNGRAVRDTDYYNASTVLAQLGRLPATSATPTAERAAPVA